MAARADVARDYSFGSAPRTRRPVYYRTEDPVVLPRSRGYSFDYRLIGAAVAATALVTAVTYAVFSTSPPALAETPTLPLSRDWSPSLETGRAAALKALAGPALSTRSLAAPQPGDFDAPVTSAPPSDFPQSSVPERVAPPSLRGSAPEVRVPVGSASEGTKAQDLVPELPPVPEVYPDPTSTPPEQIAPPEVSPEPLSPSLAPDNPYR